MTKQRHLRPGDRLEDDATIVIRGGLLVPGGLRADAAAPDRVQPGAMLLAGNDQAQAVVRVVAVDDDGQVHFAILPGSVAKNRHLLDRTVA